MKLSFEQIKDYWSLLFRDRLPHEVRPEIVRWREGDCLVLSEKVRVSAFGEVDIQDLLRGTSYPHRKKGQPLVYLWRIRPDHTVEVMTQFGHVKKYKDSQYMDRLYKPIALPLSAVETNIDCRDRLKKLKENELRLDYLDHLKQKMEKKRRMSELYHQFLRDLREIEEQFEKDRAMK